MTLFARVFFINAGLLLAATLTLALSPATISSTLQMSEIIEMAVGVLLVLVANYVLIKRAMRPLQGLASTMRRVDLNRLGARVPRVEEKGCIAELTDAFNEMVARLETERQQSGRKAIEAQEGERRRVSRELHDEVGQMLAGVVLRLGAVAREADERCAYEIGKCQVELRDGAERVREIARGLLPSSLEQLGLRSALVGLAAHTAERAPFRVEQDIATSFSEPRSDIGLVVYRVAQESLTNVMRHAGAESAHLSLRETPSGSLELKVTDDGGGLNGADLRSGRGLEGMRERALYAGGSLEVRSIEPHGTMVTLRVPVDGAAA